MVPQAAPKAYGRDGWDAHVASSLAPSSSTACESSTEVSTTANPRPSFAERNAFEPIPISSHLSTQSPSPSPQTHLACLPDLFRYALLIPSACFVQDRSPDSWLLTSAPISRPSAPSNPLRHPQTATLTLFSDTATSISLTTPYYSSPPPPSLLPARRRLRTPRRRFQQLNVPRNSFPP